MLKKCAHCGNAFTSKSSRAKYCGATCRGRAHQARRDTPEADHDEDAPQGPRLFDCALAELEKADRANSVAGVQALALARRIDSRSETGASVASLSKEFREVWDLAMADAVKVADPVDEVKERRERRLAGLG